MNIIKKVIIDNEPVMLLDSFEDVVRHRKTMDTSADSKVSTKYRYAKGGRIIDKMINNKGNKIGEILNQISACIQVHSQKYLLNIPYHS